MTTYNTGNPIGSTDVKDLCDNAQNFDYLLLGPEDSYPDRRGIARTSWTGLENQFAVAIGNLGYQYIGDYAPGLTVGSRNQIFAYAGDFWKPNASVVLPYTLTGVQATDLPNFVNIGDGALRADLADYIKGGNLVQYDPTRSVNQALTQLFAGAVSPKDVSPVSTIAALRSLDPTGVKVAMTLGYYAVGDTGGGAQYIPVPSDTTSADNGGNIIVGLAGIRWYMLHSGSVNIEQFGAIPDGSSNISPTVVIAANSGIRDIRFGKGPYRMTGNVTIPTRVSLSGIPGGGTDINWIGAGSFIMTSYTRVSGFRMDCTGMTAGNFLFLLNTATSSMEYVTVEDLYLFNCAGIMTDGNSPSFVATNIRVKGISSRLTKGPGFALRDVFAFLELRDIAVDYVGNVAAQNFTGFYIENNQGCMLDNCEVTGTTGLVAGTNAAQIGFSFVSCMAIYLRRSFADTCGGKGFSFQACQYVRAVMCTTGLCDDTATYVNSCSDVQITNHYAAGRRGLGGATASIPAIYFGACTGVLLSGGDILNATGDGVLTATNTTQISISNCRMQNNAGRGLTTGAGSVSITTGCVFASNATANYSLATAFDHLSGCQASSGALLNVTGPGAA